MIIRKLQLRNFGKFTEAGFEFRRGLNLVVGPNEAGKSTLMEAIPAILFGCRDKLRFQSWGRRGDSSGQLILERAGGTLKIERELLSNQVSLELMDSLYQAQDSFSGRVSPQGRSSEARVYAELLEEAFGLSDEQLLRASLFFGQGQLEMPANRQLPTRIKTLLTGFGSVDYDQVLQSLREDLFRLTRQNPWGKIKNRDRELELTQLQLEDAKGRLELLRTELYATEESIAANVVLDEQRSRLTDEIAKGETYLAWLKARYALDEQRVALVAQLDDLESEARLVATLEQELADLDQELLALDLDLASGPPQPQPLRDKDRLTGELRQLETEDRRCLDELQSLTAPALTRAVMATLAVVSVGLAGYVLRPDWQVSLLYGTAAAIAASWLLVCRQRLMSRLRKQELRRRRIALADRTQVCRSELQEIEHALDQLERLKRKPDVADEKPSPYVLLLRRGELAGELKTRDSAASLDARRRRLIRDLAIIDARLEAQRPLVAGKDLASDELAGAEEQLEIKKQQRTELELTLARSLVTPNRGSQLRMEVERLEEHCLELSDKTNRLQKRIAALQLGHDVLQDTVTGFREGALLRLANAAETLLKGLTSGRHAAIRFDDDLKPFLKAGNGTWKSLEMFSSGTRDLVYLVIRLAFQDMIFAGRKLPLLLDDPLVNLDQERRQRMLAVLEKLSLEHQIILFSHDQKLLGKAARDRWHVLTLEPVQGRSYSIEEERHGGQLHLL